MHLCASTWNVDPYRYNKQKFNLLIVIIFVDCGRSFGVSISYCKQQEGSEGYHANVTRRDKVSIYKTHNDNRSHASTRSCEVN